MRPVILITNHSVTLPLWKPLSETYDLCVVGGNPGLAQDLGVPAIPLTQYQNPDRSEIAINAAYAIASKLHDPVVSASMTGEFVRWTNDAPPLQLSPERASHWWPAFAGEHVRQEALLIEMLKGLFSERQVVGCVVHEDVTPDARVMVRFCQSRGVKTIHVPHAVTFYTGEKWDIHTEGISDYIAVSGDYSRDFYARWGFDPTHIAVVGSPSLDQWYTANPPSKSESRKVLGLPEDDYVVVYASTWGQLTSARGGFEDEFSKNIAMMTDYCKSEKATLVVKLHPGEAQGQENFYMERLKQSGVNGCVLRGYNEYVLRAGDVLVSHSPSNILLQGAIAGTPCAYIPSEDFETDGAIRVGDSVKTAIDVARGMSREYWDDWMRKMNFVHGRTETATELTTAFIKEICK